MRRENKLGLTSSTDLAREEEGISKKKAVELFENGVLDTLLAGKFSTLRAIHKYLFEDICDCLGNGAFEKWYISASEQGGNLIRAGNCNHSRVYTILASIPVELVSRFKRARRCFV